MATERKTAQIAGTIPRELREAIEDHRWSARKTVSDVVNEAMQLYAAHHKLPITGQLDVEAPAKGRK